MSVLYRFSQSSYRRLTPISVSYLSFVHPRSHPNPNPNPKLNPKPNPKPSPEHNSELYNQYFSLKKPYIFSQNALFSTSSDVVQGSNHASGGKDDDNNGKLKNEAGKTWVDLYLPQGVRPYAKLARLDRPIGTWLLAWPCMW